MKTCRLASWKNGFTEHMTSHDLRMPPLLHFARSLQSHVYYNSIPRVSISLRLLGFTVARPFCCAPLRSNKCSVRRREPIQLEIHYKVVYEFCEGTPPPPPPSDLTLGRILPVHKSVSGPLA